jgi:hypothetical protein
VKLSTFVRSLVFALSLGCFNSSLSATALLFGTFGADGNETVFTVQALTTGTLTVQSVGYGGSGIILGGGFAPSLSLYDPFGNQIAHDFVGGTAVGLGCSNGANQDASTHLCEDSGFAFPIVTPGFYAIYLTEQGNDGPDPLSNGFALNLGDNFSPGPFIDPGLPGNVQRTGNWALTIAYTGTDIVTQSDVPEPSTLFLGCLVLCVLAYARTRRYRRS